VRALGALLALALAAVPQWKQVDKADGIETYERDVEGERVVELKLVTVSKLPVDALCTAALGPTTLDPAEPDITLRKLLSFDGGVRVEYEQVSAPVVSDRDYAVASYRTDLPNGGCRTHFEAANQYAPKLPDGFVRIEKLRGGWSFEPVAGGNVVCTYTVFTDPGGSLPAAFVEGPRKKTAVKWVKLVLERAAKAAAQRDGGRD
jgi:hypothetical protein